MALAVGTAHKVPAAHLQTVIQVPTDTDYWPCSPPVETASSVRVHSFVPLYGGSKQCGSTLLAPFRTTGTIQHKFAEQHLHRSIRRHFTRLISVLLQCPLGNSHIVTRVSYRGRGSLGFLPQFSCYYRSVPHISPHYVFSQSSCTGIFISRIGPPNHGHSTKLIVYTVKFKVPVATQEQSRCPQNS